jgi:hypothetical protein
VDAVRRSANAGDCLRKGVKQYPDLEFITSSPRVCVAIIHLASSIAVLRHQRSLPFDIFGAA